MFELENFKKGDPELAETAESVEEHAHNLPFNTSKLLNPDLLTIQNNKRLGSGNFGIVCEGEYQGRQVAVKTLKDALELEKLEAFFKELKIMSYVGKHENIVELIGAEVSNILGGKVRAVIEFCPHGSLEHYLRSHRKSFLAYFAIDIDINNTSAEAASPVTSTSLELVQLLELFESPVQLLCRWCQQISHAMSFLASKGIVHGDLATRNVLVADGYVLKLADFGMSRNLYKSAVYIQRNKGRALPWCWLPPEVLEYQQFSVKSDVWSYGVTLWEVFEFAKIPYPNLTWDNEFVENLKNGSLRLAKPKLMPQEIYDDVVLRCFVTNPEARIDFAGTEEYWREYLTPQPQLEGNGYHQIPINTLYDRLKSHPTQGLNDRQVRRNMEKFGKNVTTSPKQASMWFKFFKTLIGGFQVLVLATSSLSFAAYLVESRNPWKQYHLYVGIAMIILTIVLGCFTSIQEYSRSKAMKSILKNMIISSKCIRNCRLQWIDASKLVVGDIVEVKSGDTIPADIRIIEASGFEVDRSSITGESDSQLGTSECTSKNPADTRNLVLFPATVLKGTAKGIVVSVGDNTFIGRVGALASGLSSPNSPLTKTVRHLIILISAIAVFYGLAFFICLLAMSGRIFYDWNYAIFYLIDIIIAGVPVGLPVTFPVIMASATKRMANKNCLVKQQYAVETLGSATVMCFDKTGTLTENLMTVNHMWFSNRIHETDDGIDKRDAGFQALARAACLCSRVAFLVNQQHLPIEQRNVEGGATEASIFRCMESHFGDVVQHRQQSPKVFEIPFNSENKWQLSIHETIVDGIKKYLLVMKGAPEQIMSYCSTILICQKEYQLNKNSDWWKDTFESVCEKLGENGERILGFCDLELSEEEYPIGFEFTAENTEYLKLGLRFVGLMSMLDPLRRSAVETVQSCRAAGIKVVMVTGDHPSTAKAIAKKIGISCPDPDDETIEERQNQLSLVTLGVDADADEGIVVNGEELNKFSIEQLDGVLRNHKEIVFASVSPKQKLLIVEGFQRLNEVVAMIGEGVNDAAALKKADVGIALGISGSEVAKESANLILLDDNLASIVAGVAEGRLIFGRLMKTFCHLVTTNIAFLVPLIVFIIRGIPLPLGQFPIVLICLGNGIVQTISLLFDKSEMDLMKKPPRDHVRNKFVTDGRISVCYVPLGFFESLAGIISLLIVFTIITVYGFLLI